MPTLTKRKRAPAQEASPAASEDELPDADADSDTQRQSNGASEDELTKRYVRLALACELQRRPITRTEIKDKVYNGASTRQFKKVFELAQTELRAVFGMQMQELPAKEKITLAQKRAAQKNETQKATTSWMLVSTLPPEYHLPDILPASQTQSAANESVYIAIYSMVVAAIALNHGSVPDTKLDRYLTQMGLGDQTPVEGYQKPDLLLKRMQKDGYILRIAESIGSGEEEIIWVLGPRGKLEVGDQGVKGLVKTVYGEAGHTELANKIGRSLGSAERPVQAPANKQRKVRRQATAGANNDEDDNEDDNNDDDDDDHNND